MDALSALDRGKTFEHFVKSAPPFVGRRQHLDWIEQSLQETIAGRPRLILVTRDAGIGKTRLLQEVRQDALRRGLQVGYGRCYEDLTLPYLPFVESLNALLNHSDRHLKHLLDGDANPLGRLLRPVGATSSLSLAAAIDQGGQDKLQLFLAVSQAIMTLAHHCPTLCVLDDLHWADNPSLDLFNHLVFTLSDAALRASVRLLIIVTYRPVEPGSQLNRLIARLQRESICQTIQVVGLSELEIHELLRGMGVLRPSHQLTETIAEVTQGNPLFIQEVVHHLAQQGALQERGGYVISIARPDTIPLPAEVTGAIVARTRKLSTDCQQLLTLASFLGDRFPLPLLHVISGLTEDTVLNLLEEGLQQHMLCSDEQGFQFAHPLIRHVFYRQPSVTRRQHIHQQIASTLEGLLEGDLEARLLEVAHHLIKAGPAARATSVIDYARRAGDHAYKLFAWSEAAYFYEGALAAAQSTDLLPVQERAELHYRAGLAHHWGQDAGPCLDHYGKAIDAYRLSGEIRGLGQALMEKTRTQLTLASVPLGMMIDLQPLKETLAALGESEPALRGSIAAIMAEVYRTARQADQATEMAQQALDIGRRLNDHHLCGRANFVLGLAQIHGLHVKDALECWKCALAFARQTGDLILQGWPLQRMPLALILQGRLHEAESVALEACELTRKTRAWGDDSVALSHLTCIAVACGDFVKAEHLAREVMLMVYRSRYPWGGFRGLLALACARALRGAWAEAADALSMLEQPGHVFEDPGPVIPAFTQTFRLILEGQRRGEVGSLERVAADLMQAMETDTYSLAPLCALVELGDLTTMPTIARLARQNLSLAAERGVVLSSGWMFLIPRVLGVAASLNHQWQEAEGWFRSAIESATSIGVRPELGRTYLDYARMLVVQGGKGARHHANELLKQAGIIFDESGMLPLAQRTVELAAKYHTRLERPDRARTPRSLHLDERESEILGCLASGKNDEEIAYHLVLSPDTIAQHLQTIFRKIHVSDRTAAVDYMVQQGLRTPISAPIVPETISERGHGDDVGHKSSRVAILVTDMKGSGALIQRWGDAQAHELFRVHNAILRDCLRRHDGTEVAHTGDGIEASFPSASSALTCAIAMQTAFAQYYREHPEQSIRVRIGIHGGRPIPTEGRLFGSAVHTTFRICDRAQPGQILVSDVIRRLSTNAACIFVDRGLTTLRGLSGRIRLHEIRSSRMHPDS